MYTQILSGRMPGILLMLIYSLFLSVLLIACHRNSVPQQTKAPAMDQTASSGTATAQTKPVQAASSGSTSSLTAPNQPVSTGTAAYLAMNPQLKGREIVDANGNPQLLGECSRVLLTRAPYASWFLKNYSDYTVDSGLADNLKPQLKGKSFTIFLGTWCGDSRREVPRILRILDYCGVDSTAVRLIMVNNADSAYKQSPGHEERGRDIFRVPDLLVMDQDQEKGRIVESPVMTLEKDMLLIMSGCASYKPHYAGQAYLARLFHQEPVAQLGTRLPDISDQLRPLLSSATELRSYAHVLQSAGEREKADLALKLNAMIFKE